MPQRIQLSRQRGWKMPPNTVKVDRTTAFGNPYRIGEPVDMKMVRKWGWNFSPAGRQYVCIDVSEAVRKFEHALYWDVAIHDWLREELGGKDLACWCAPGQPCHADALLLIANSDPIDIAAAHKAEDEAILKQSRDALEAPRG